MEGIAWDGSSGSTVDVGWSDGGVTSDGSQSSAVDDGSSNGSDTIGAVTSSIDGSGEISQWVISIEFEDSTSDSMDSGHGAKSRSNTLDSPPSFYLINAYDGFVWTSFNFSTNGYALLFRLNLLTNTDLPGLSHVRADVTHVNLLEKPKKR